MKTAIVFPGQGAQTVGMGKDLYENSSIAKDVYDLVDKIASNSEKHQKQISEISFNGPEDELKKTLYTQPAILALSLSIAKIAKEEIKNSKLANPSYVAGHSLGEFAALYMADVISLEDAIRLVIKRSELMEAAPAGAMSAVVGLDENKLNEIVNETEGCSVANYNAPDQIVITGTPEGVKSVENKVNEYASSNSLKVRVIALAVGGAFHSPLMQKASEEFASLIDAAEFNNAKIPVIQNFTGTPITDANEIKSNLKKQMTGSVQWTKTVRFILDNKIESALEFGPGAVLAGLFKKQERRFPVQSIGNFEAVKNLSLVNAIK